MNNEHDYTPTYTLFWTIKHLLLSFLYRIFGKLKSRSAHMKTHKFLPDQQRADVNESYAGRSADNHTPNNDTASLSFSTCSNFCLTIGQTANSVRASNDCYLSPTSISPQTNLGIFSFQESDDKPKETLPTSYRAAKRTISSAQRQTSVTSRSVSSKLSVDYLSVEKEDTYPISPLTKRLPASQDLCSKSRNILSTSNEPIQEPASTKLKATSDIVFPGQRFKSPVSSSQRKWPRKHKVR